MGDVPQPGRWFIPKMIVVILIGAVIIGGFCYALAQGLGTLPAFNDQKRIQVCDFSDPDDLIIVVIREDDFNSNVYSKNLDDCK